MIETAFYEVVDGAVRCGICERRCVIPEGQRGVCGLRKNINSKLYFTHYGKVVALHVDPIEKKPLYHFYPGTKTLSYAIAGCNFKCLHCQNWEISQNPDAPYREISPEGLVEYALSASDGVSHTYTEPTVFYEYARDVGHMANERGLYNVWVTNGYFTEEVLEDLKNWVNAMNIDYKGDDEFYKKVAGGVEGEIVRRNIKKAFSKGIHVEVTYLVIPGYNDDVSTLLGICEFLADISDDIPLHITRFHPDYMMRDIPPTPVDVLISFKKKAEEILNFVYVGNVLDWELNSTFCPSCGELLIKRDYTVHVLIKEPKCPSCGRKLPIIM